jgi:hypothetical protein
MILENTHDAGFWFLFYWTVQYLQMVRQLLNYIKAYNQRVQANIVSFCVFITLLEIRDLQGFFTNTYNNPLP